MTKKIQVFLNPILNWKTIATSHYKIHYIGGFNDDKNNINDFNNLAKTIRKNQNPDFLKKYFSNINGHYSIIYQDNKKVFALVDWIRAFPIFYAKVNKKVFFSNCPKLLKTKTNISKLDYSAALDIASSGYATGRRTLFKHIKQIQPGQFLYDKKNQLNVETYNSYYPKSTTSSRIKYNLIKKKFIEALDEVFSNLV